MTPSREERPTRGLSRRHLLFGGAVAGLGAAAAVGGDQLIRSGALADAASGIASGTGGGADAGRLHGTTTVPFHGEHQAGIAIVPQSFSVFLALDLRPEVDRAALGRMMRILSDDAARLTQGRPPLADTEPELAVVPARLTVTFGFGPGLVERATGARPTPAWLAPLPAFSIDCLEERWSHGDLLIEVAADDPLTIAHAARMLLKDARSFATLRWRQDGFRRTVGAEAPGMTMRNLFGQLDGTANAQPGTSDFDELVWSREGWLAGGTGYVIRRIRMDLDTWDELDRPGREASMGRTLDTGAPLTGTNEHDEPDFAATNAAGFPVIASFAHMRRARSDNPRERIVRRGYNYETPATGGDALSDTGLVFAAFQADVTAQYVPLQRRLDELDLLNKWTTPIGSAVFALPPGCAEGGFVGETLLG